MNVQQNTIFAKKFQFNKFFTKAVKKVLVEKFGERAHFNFEATQNVLLPSRKGGEEMSGVRPFPFKLDIGKTTCNIYIHGWYVKGMPDVLPEIWEELPEEVVKNIIEHTEKMLTIIEPKEGDVKPTIDVEVVVNIDEKNYSPMNDPESLKLVRELEGLPPKQSKNELHQIADKISKEGVDPEIVTKIVEIVLATLPLVMKK